MSNQVGLDITKSIGKEGSIFLFQCTDCTKIIKSKPYYLVKHSGKCKSCVMKKRPYEHLYTKFINTAKNERHKNELAYEDFVELCKIKKCHYCFSPTKVPEFCYKNSKYVYGNYSIDRKNNDIGYTKENSVSCCTRCNIAKGDRYTYEEWLGMTEYLRKTCGL